MVNNGDILIPSTYEQLGWTDSTDYFVDDVIGYYDENWGIISIKNKIVTPAEYFDLLPVHKDLIIASKKGQFSNRVFYGALNSKGQSVIDFKYSSISKVANTLIVAEEKDGLTKYGLLDEKNKFLLEPVYENIQYFNQDLFVFTQGESGLIKRDGEILIPLSLDSIGNLESNKATIYSAGKMGLLDGSGQVIIKPAYKAIQPESTSATVLEFNSHTIVNHLNHLDKEFDCDSLIHFSNHFYGIYLNDYLSVSDKNFNVLLSGNQLKVTQSVNDKLVVLKDGNYGVLNTNGEFEIPAEYDSIWADQGYFYLKNRKGWSVANKYTRMITKRHYDELMPATESMIAVKRRGYWGFIDFDGHEEVAFKFDSVTPFRHHTSKVGFLSAYGTINQFGEWICQPKYDQIIIHKDGIAEARKGSRIDLVNRDGEIIFQTYNKLTPYDGGFIEETTEGKIGFVMRDGRIVKHPIFDEITFTSQDSVLIAKENDYLSIATKDGDRFYSLSGRFEEVIGIKEGFVGIKLDGRYGFVDLQGRLRIANRYDSVRLYNEGMAAFYLRGHWGYIDKDENLKVQPVYDSSFDFINGLAIVIENNKYGLINKEGEYLLDSEYQHISRNQFGSYLLQKDGKYGLAAIDGTTVAPTNYTFVEEVEAGQVVVKRRGQYGV